MSDVKEDLKDQNNEITETHFSIEKVYLKDVSFEAPAAPAVFTEAWAPEINMELNSRANSIDENVYDVEITITVTAKNNDKVAFLVEVKQCGVFSIVGMDDATLDGMLGSFCPNILFPYAREAISDLVGKGGFPQLLLAPVNFDALYAQHLQQREGVTVN